VSPNPALFLDHLRQHGYHSRSDKHSNALAAAIVNDLVERCRAIRAKAGRGQLVYDLNFDLVAGTAVWNVDLVLGSPEFGTDPPLGGQTIRRAPPSRVEIAIEIKSVMTEHRKAIKNRKRDLEAHHEHVHNYSNRAIAGGVLVVNGAEVFKSPLRAHPTTHRRIEQLVALCVSELRSVAARGGATGYGLEARCAIVLDMGNVEPGSVSYIAGPPAPQVGDQLHYEAFVQALCDIYAERFPLEEDPGGRVR
jgi:hypothetical protein